MTTKIIPYLDGWRGLAIIAVLVSHFSTSFVGWIGQFGVQLFFALSGYLMGGLLFVKHVELPNFFARRFSRVFPTLWIFVAAMSVYAGFQPKPHDLSFSELASVLTFTRSYFGETSIWAREWPIGHLWSLAVEEHSYVALAIIAFIVRDKGKFAAPALLVLAVIAVLAANFTYAVNPPNGATPWMARSEAAAVGLLASAAYRVVRDRFPFLSQSHPVLLLAGFTVAVLCFSMYSYKGLEYTLAPLCLAYVINHISSAPKFILAALSNGWLRWFGLSSFSVYLWQQPFHHAYLMYGMNAWIAMAGAVLTGAASYYWLEDPARLYLNRKWAERREQPSVEDVEPSRLA